MKKNECNVIRDIMPLVLDRAASDESRELVEEHIRSCEECRKQYDAMKAELPEETRAEYEEEQKQFTEALKTVRKTKLKRRFRLISLAALICLIAALAGSFAYYSLFLKSSAPVDNSLYSLSMCKLADGHFVLTVDTGRINFSTDTHLTEVVADGKDILYLLLQAPPIHAAGLPEGSRSVKWAVMTGDDSEETVDEIRQGTPQDYIVIWKKGDPVPAASEEMERYYTLEKAFDRWVDSFRNDAGNISITVTGTENEFFAWQDRLEDARLAVPEWK